MDVVLGAVPASDFVGRVIGTAVAENVHAVPPDVRSHVGTQKRPIPTLPASGCRVDDARGVRIVMGGPLTHEVHVDAHAGTSGASTSQHNGTDDGQAHHDTRDDFLGPAFFFNHYWLHPFRTLAQDYAPDQR